MVGAPYESNREFYYPTPYPKVIHTPDNRPLDTSKAEVGLAEIPFVRLRGGLDERLLKGSATFSEVVAAAQRALDSPVLEIDLDRKCIHSGGQEVPLPPAQLAFLSWLARRAKEGQPDVECPSDGVPESEYAREYLGEYANLSDDVDSATARRLRRAKGMDKTFFEQTKSRLRRKLQDALGPDGMRRYGVVDDGNRPKKYRVAVPAESIRWSGGMDELEPDVPLRKLAKSSSKHE